MNQAANTISIIQLAVYRDIKSTTDFRFGIPPVQAVADDAVIYKVKLTYDGQEYPEVWMRIDDLYSYVAGGYTSINFVFNADYSDIFVSSAGQVPWYTPNPVKSSVTASPGVDRDTNYSVSGNTNAIPVKNKANFTPVAEAYEAVEDVPATTKIAPKYENTPRKTTNFEDIGAVSFGGSDDEYDSYDEHYGRKRKPSDFKLAEDKVFFGMNPIRVVGSYVCDKLKSAHCEEDIIMALLYPILTPGMRSTLNAIRFSNVDKYRFCNPKRFMSGNNSSTLFSPTISAGRIFGNLRLVSKADEGRSMRRQAYYNQRYYGDNVNDYYYENQDAMVLKESDFDESEFFMARIKTKDGYRDVQMNPFKILRKLVNNAVRFTVDGNASVRTSDLRYIAKTTKDSMYLTFKALGISDYLNIANIRGRNNKGLLTNKRLFGISKDFIQNYSMGSAEIDYVNTMVSMNLENMLTNELGMNTRAMWCKIVSAAKYSEPIPKHDWLELAKSVFEDCIKEDGSFDTAKYASLKRDAKIIDLDSSDFRKTIENTTYKNEQANNLYAARIRLALIYNALKEGRYPEYNLAQMIKCTDENGNIITNLVERETYGNIVEVLQYADGASETYADYLERTDSADYKISMNDIVVFKEIIRALQAESVYRTGRNRELLRVNIGSDKSVTFNGYAAPKELLPVLDYTGFDFATLTKIHAGVDTLTEVDIMDMLCVLAKSIDSHVYSMQDLSKSENVQKYYKTCRVASRLGESAVLDVTLGKTNAKVCRDIINALNYEIIR